MKQALEMALAKVQEFKSLWWKVPPFEKKVNKATREALIFAHNPIFEIEHLIKEALAQPEQEPVACVGPWHDCRLTLIPRYSHQTFERDQPLYTTPPQRKPLTDEQIDSVMKSCINDWGLRQFARAIEVAHGIKE